MPIALSPSSDTTNLAAGDYTWPAGAVAQNNKPIKGVRGQTKIILTPDGAGQGMQYKGDNWSVKDVVFTGARIHLDSSNGRNRGLLFDNVEFRNSNKEAIHFTSGLNDTKITNCLFTGAKSLAIYGYNYLNLLIANNEFIDNDGGMHIDAFGGSGNLLVEQNLISGCNGMGMEFQGSAADLVFQDNYYEKPQVTDNSNKMAYSLILDKSSKIRIRRNVCICPIKTGNTYVRIIFEVGGDDCLVEDNYSDGGNHIVAMNDGVGSASVLVRNNLFKNFAQDISASFPSSERILTQYNNNPNVQLTWDFNRGKPGRNKRYGDVIVTPPPTVDPCQSVKDQLTQTQNKLNDANTEIAKLKSTIDDIHSRSVY